ncbi:MAG TPA: SDR family oxidoreductase [Roseiflexaceae bacterium]|nr:SDR family oxidoreductase [Roseiflexaceae bacterium]
MATQDLSGKICLVTGATAGIGEVTARRLAGMGAAVTIVGRNVERAAASAARIKAATGATVEFLLADLSSQADIRRLANEFLARHSRLDVLVNNAGAIFKRRLESVDGIEMTWALNHMSYFLLTNLLLGALQAAAPSCIVNVASDAHNGAQINFDDPQLKRGYSAWRAYGQSKLANILFTVELARRLDGTAVSANALHPGFVASNFGKNNGGLFAILIGLAQRVAAISPESGADTSIYLASSPEVAGVSGQYFETCRAVMPSAEAQDRTAAARLWQLSEALVGATATLGRY